MLTKSEKVLNKIRSIREELNYPTKMNLRSVTQSEMFAFKLKCFPSGEMPVVGSFLNVEWLALLDFNGLTIKPLDKTETDCYTIPFHAKNSQELASAISHTLDDLTRLTDEKQLFAFEFLLKHKFVMDQHAKNK